MLEEVVGAQEFRNGLKVGESQYFLWNHVKKFANLKRYINNYAFGSGRADDFFTGLKLVT
jgi:hypothetical protein